MFRINFIEHGFSSGLLHTKTLICPKFPEELDSHYYFAELTPTEDKTNYICRWKEKGSGELKEKLYKAKEILNKEKRTCMYTNVVQTIKLAEEKEELWYCNEMCYGRNIMQGCYIFGSNHLSRFVREYIKSKSLKKELLGYKEKFDQHKMFLVYKVI